MKYIKFIAILVALFTVSCIEEDIVTNEHTNKGGSSQIQLAARILPFTEYDVATRATRDGQQVVYDFIIFGNDSKCVYYNHGTNDIINIDRATAFGNASQDNLSACDIYVLVNYPGIYETIIEDAIAEDANDVIQFAGTKSLDYFANITSDIAHAVNMLESDLPRIGSITKIDLSTSSSISSGTILPIDLQSLYAKMVFNIKVDPTEEVADIINPNANTFQFEGYTVSNLPKKIDLWPGTEGDTHDAVEVYTEPVDGVLGNDVNQTPTTELSFSFYLPERFFKPETSADEYEYPFGKGSSIREEDLDRRQRYKPKLGQGYTANDINYAGATYVTISGVFTNHQGHTFDVSYDIYVGNDNFGNFDIVRNRQYNNSIKITGIHNSTNQEAGDVSIDYRVDISHTRPIYSNLRRETLLDAHYEVRPLRIRRNDKHSGDEKYVKVEVIYDNGVTYPDGKGNWIGLERSFGVTNKDIRDDDATYSDLYCPSSSGSSAGKRKYFTYDLVNKSFSKGSNTTDDLKPLHTSTSVVVPIPETKEDNECVWIYVDECTEASAAKDAKRSATIRLTCGKYVNDEFTPVGEPIDYVINQHKLFEVSWKGRKYHIEHEEEYLHNFDSEDTYEGNKTEEEGMEWGLHNAQLSFDDNALFFDTDPNDDFFGTIINNIQQDALTKVPLKYDFYVPKHDKEIVSSKAIFHPFNGYDFFYDIVDDINANNTNRDTKFDGRINDLPLSEISTYAIEYCYNRNKRQRNGMVANDYRKWYLPAIDEMEDIMMGGHNYFDEFHGKFYWSCQPSYVPNYAYFDGWVSKNTGSYYIDDRGVYNDDSGNSIKKNVGYARATKAIHKSGTMYDYAPSGASGYEDGIRMYTKLGWSGLTGDYEFKYSGTLNNKSLNTFTREEDLETQGNHKRSTKHRVRCVYYNERFYTENKTKTEY